MIRDKLTFDQVLESIDKITDDALIEECVTAIKYGDIIFNPGIVQEKDKLVSLYSLRVNIKKEKQKDRFTVEELIMWGLDVKTLSQYGCELLI
ncbi:hypothetical protein V6R21_00425 [Limibacter armeniacum]|uniref:hypothetical protein n=1 Tax=Limibacter armeniacum TaxID=466084 RepID=UPI002FE5F08E